MLDAPCAGLLAKHCGSHRKSALGTWGRRVATVVVWPSPRRFGAVDELTLRGERTGSSSTGPTWRTYVPNVILETLAVPTEVFERGTGWALKPQGACRGEICVPLPMSSGGDTVDVPAVADRLGMPLIHDEEEGLWALGPASSGRALPTAEAPDFELPDLDGRTFRLSSLRGQKVLIVAWAPY